MDKTYSPAEIETRQYARWEAAGWFAPRPGGAPYAIVIPPPNVTGTLHMGHAFQDTIMDALTRYHRMLGDETLWQPGTDHAGIATQMVVERQLNASEGTRHDLGDARIVGVELGHGGREVHEQVGRDRRLAADPDRRLGRRAGLGGAAARERVRDEGAVGEGPQQGVEALGLGRRREAHAHGEPLQEGLLDHAAGIHEPRPVVRALEDVEVDAWRHQARDRRKSTSSGTGRPVLPLLAPET